MHWWEMIAQRFRAPYLMEQMMRRFGALEKIKQGPEGARTLRSAAIRCIGCGEARACGEWLNEERQAETPPAYCRNTDLIRRLRDETATRH